MPITKIPDSLLEKLRCQCGQYLSKAPINIRDGQSICKDCIDLSAPTATTVANNAPYEALASIFAFPCRYEHQGCLQQIKFSEVENHELICAYRTYNCPVSLHSSCNWKGAISQLHQHYESEHPELYLESPNFNFSLNENFEVYKLVKFDGIVLLLQTKCELEMDKLWFNMVCFRDADDAALINYEVELRNSDATARYIKLENANAMPITSTQMIANKSVDVDLLALVNVLKYPESIECCWLINVSKELKNKIKDEQEFEKQGLPSEENESIKCPNCGIYMVSPIYRCNRDHLTCSECKGYYSECKSCQRKNVEFARASNLEKVSESVPHYCRWVNCRQELSYEEVRQHEQSCPSRIYRCPACNIWSGLYSEILDHFQSMHPENMMYNANPISVVTNTFNPICGYILTHRDIFKFFVKQNFNFNVHYLGSCDNADNWEYRVTRGDNANAVSYLEKADFNLYAKQICSENGIRHFSGKITFGVPLLHTYTLHINIRK